MSTSLFFGVISVDQQNYAMPLSEIIAIESNETVESIDGEMVITYQDQAISLNELSSVNINHKLRDLSIIINDGQSIAVQVDAFDTRQLDEDKIQGLPEVMITDNSVIRELYFDEDTNEVLLILRKEFLVSYLDYKSHA